LRPARATEAQQTKQGKASQIRRNCLFAKGTTAQSLRNEVEFVEGKEKMLVNEEGEKQEPKDKFKLRQDRPKIRYFS
jgi:hypothetical protein